MPRVLQSRRHSLFQPIPAATGATRRARTPFKYRIHQKKTNLQRVSVALHAIRPVRPTLVQEILQKVSDQATESHEVLGSRWKQFAHVALSILRKNGYLQVQDDDNDEYCWLTEDGVQIMAAADGWFTDLDLPPIEKYGRIGQYLSWLISPKRMRPLTRRELDLENRQLEQQQKLHMKICPLEPRPINAAASQHETLQDFMDVGVSVVGPSRIQKPFQKLSFLHNPAAYPTPESIPRARSSLQPASVSPPQTPLSRHHPSGFHEEGNSSDHDDQADIDSVAIAVSNKGERAVDQVVVLTCHNMDWDNIGHVTAISKALQEKNDMLQQKMEVLEKEKEECTNQLNQANSKVEHIEAEMCGMRSRSWLLRWRFTSAMIVLQKALDSAIHERESHEQQNVRLKARLDDIDRRRAAIRRIEDAENAPDDRLLTVIAESLTA